MSPPINTPDGSEVSEIVLPDGSTASEVIDPDGNVVFEAGPDIPDTSMFQSPIYQFVASDSDAPDGGVGEFPEVLGSLADATATDDPTRQNNYQSTGKDMFVYDDGSDSTEDEHSTSPDANLTNSGEMGVFVTFYSPSDSDQALVGLTTNNDVGLGREKGSWGIGVAGANSFGGGDWVENQLTTAGYTFDMSTGSFVIYGDGSQQASNSTSFDISQISDIRIGMDSANVGPMDGGIFEVVFTSSTESLSNYQEYHNNRVS